MHFSIKKRVLSHKSRVPPESGILLLSFKEGFEGEGVNDVPAARQSRAQARPQAGNPTRRAMDNVFASMRHIGESAEVKNAYDPKAGQRERYPKSKNMEYRVICSRDTPCPYIL